MPVPPGDEMRENFESGHVCWDDKDIICGRPTGAVRISLGHVSTFHDVFMAVRYVALSGMAEKMGMLKTHPILFLQASM